MQLSRSAATHLRVRADGGLVAAAIAQCRHGVRTAATRGQQQRCKERAGTCRMCRPSAVAPSWPKRQEAEAGAGGVSDRTALLAPAGALQAFVVARHAQAPNHADCWPVRSTNAPRRRLRAQAVAQQAYRSRRHRDAGRDASMRHFQWQRLHGGHQCAQDGAALGWELQGRRRRVSPVRSGCFVAPRRGVARARAQGAPQHHACQPTSVLHACARHRAFLARSVARSVLACGSPFRWKRAAGAPRCSMVFVAPAAVPRRSRARRFNPPPQLPRARQRRRPPAQRLVPQCSAAAQHLWNRRRRPSPRKPLQSL